MNRLDPEELLSFLTKLNDKQNIPLSDVEVGEHMDEDGLIRVDMKIDSKDFHLYAPADWSKEIGAMWFYLESPEARLYAESLVVLRIRDYYENVYREWIYNSTGYKINNEFNNLVLEQLLKLEKKYIL